MQFIYKNLTVQVIINLDANLIMAFCKGNDPIKFKTGIKDGKTIKTVDYMDLGSINYTINVPINSNEEDNLSLSSIMKKVCFEIDNQKI